ncbi:hypothetical protein VOLCADRAFT_117441 [Volvox carteri f. nagariensis]|uniref:ATP-NAD kinase n=1 Tax=Volvox carteri f. nagariensis TaxID=3068 RepID=D8TUE1_VOLCA|nr:uncharacterized protein VOLCADRAFT_117441 [Volvox carteri f. nagariensis]EFJ48692.1 hypothetical protein VOLCADRAFT_117441 [Volvox carteri f. nagariensis]|eukprot:XP_002950024.1 hypothetical protein VOLCADRAFT_117441 [Volvox carteri f. nagariensis]
MEPISKSFLRRSVCTEGEAFESGIIRGAAVKYNDSAALRLRRRALIKWQPGAPSKVLIVKKPKNPAASTKLHEIGAWLRARGIEVFVERVVWATEFKEFSIFDPHVNRHDIDFCISLGGDGTVLYLTSLFEEDEPLPPVLCFAMGTLGFLTPFDVANFEATLERVLDTNSQPLYCTLRTRKRCEVVYDGRLEAVHHVLNECVLDRGAFPGAVLLEIFVDGSYVTNVEADGLIISTPSGSTAYSMSAGGPVVAPSVPCTVFTPIAPLSLSFRPVVIPESSSICVHLPTCARSHARASFDGRKPMRVRRGTSLFFTTSLCPLPVISLGPMDTDWYEGITSKLKWNQAIRQLPSCPSPVGAQQQELCSARLADRAAAEVALAAAEGCPVPDDAYLVHAAAAAAAAALPRHSSERNILGLGRPTVQPQSQSSGGATAPISHGPALPAGAAGTSGSCRSGNGNGNGTVVRSNGSSTGTLGSVHSFSVGGLAGGHRSGSGSGWCSVEVPDDGSATDSMTNSLDDPNEAAQAAEMSRASVAVTVAAAALAAASKPLRPAVMRTRPIKIQQAGACAVMDVLRADPERPGYGGGRRRGRGRRNGGGSSGNAAAAGPVEEPDSTVISERGPVDRARHLA